MSRSNGKIVPPIQRYAITKTVSRKRRKKERERERGGKREIDEF